ncbi:hypothetical protein YC2023_030708 [Brassica napus]
MFFKCTLLVLHVNLHEKFEAENDNLKVFSFTELKKATKNFRECTVVDGDNRSSRKFYKGYIDEYVPSRAGTGITASVLDVGRLDLKSDVFTLGVILLDLVTGSKDTIRKERRKSIATTGPSLLCDNQKIREIIDPRLRNDYPVNAVKKMGILIQRCTKWDKNERPLMQQVLDSLSYIAEFKTNV